MAKLYTIFILQLLVIFATFNVYSSEFSINYLNPEDDGTEITISNVTCYTTSTQWRFVITVGSNLSNGTVTYKESVTGDEKSVTLNGTETNILGVTGDNNLEITVTKGTYSNKVYLNAPDCDNCEDAYPISSPVIDDEAEYCEGSSPYLEANVNTGDDVSWYLNPLGGNAVSSNNPYTPGNANNKVYYVATKRGQCESLIRKKVTIKERSNPVLLSEESNCSPDLKSWNVSLFVDKGNVSNPNQGYTPQFESDNQWSISNISKDVDPIEIKITDPVAVADGSFCFTNESIVAPVCDCGEEGEAPVLKDNDQQYCANENIPRFEIENPDPNVKFKWWDEDYNVELFTGEQSYYTPNKPGNFSVQEIDKITGCPSQKANFTLTRYEVPEIEVLNDTKGCEDQGTDSVSWNIEIIVTGGEIESFQPDPDIESMGDGRFKLSHIPAAQDLIINLINDNNCTKTITVPYIDCNCPPRESIAKAPTIEITERGCDIVTLTAEDGDPSLDYYWEAPSQNVNGKIIYVNRNQYYVYRAYQKQDGCPGEISDTLKVSESTFYAKPDHLTFIAKPRENPVVLIYPQKSEYTFQWFKAGSMISGATGQYYYDSNLQNSQIMLVATENLHQCTDTMYYPDPSAKRGFLTSEYEFRFIAQSGLFQIYPNPGDKQVTLNVDPSLLLEETLICRIFDLTGRCVEEFQVDQITEIIQTERLISGMYNVVLYSDDLKISTQKLILK